MLKKNLWKMSFFSHTLFLLLAFSSGRNLPQATKPARHVWEITADTLEIPGVQFAAVPLNVHSQKFVKDFIRKNSEDLEVAKERGRNCFTMMDEIFTRYDLPVELKYLAVIESDLKKNAVSHVGAVGPWQLMPTTARTLGLKVSGHVDERKSYYKSTVAAAKYLKDLYNQFGDWLLVIAAYNGGPAPIYKAIHRSGSHNFWKLQSFLPSETRAHVKRYIGTHYYFEGQGGLTTMTKAEMGEYLQSVAFVKEKKQNDTFQVSKEPAVNTFRENTADPNVIMTHALSTIRY